MYASHVRHSRNHELIIAENESSLQSRGSRLNYHTARWGSNWGWETQWSQEEDRLVTVDHHMHSCAQILKELLLIEYK